MPTDLKTEVVQLISGAEALNDLLSAKLERHNNTITTSQSGVRTGEHHEIVGLAQILTLTQAYLLEVAIKLLHQLSVPERPAARTHDLSALFRKLPEEVRARLLSGWESEPQRSKESHFLAFGDFLAKYRDLFVDTRYLFERETLYSIATKDFKIAALVVLGEVVRHDPSDTVLHNIYGLAQTKLNRQGLPPLVPWSSLGFSSSQDPT